MSAVLGLGQRSRVVQWAMAKVLKVSDGCVSNQKRFIYINTPTKALGAQWKRGKKD